MNRVDRFQKLIGESSPDPASNLELVGPLRDFAEAIRKTGVAAEVRESSSGGRHQLVLSPLNRPAFQSIVLTVQFTGGRGVVLATPPFWFTSADELTEWLAVFAALPEFKATLAVLREQAREPVDARLERENGMATMARVSADRQEKLGAMGAGEEQTFEVELLANERAPDASALRRFDSAGLKFEVLKATINERQVTLRIVRH